MSESATRPPAVRIEALSYTYPDGTPALHGIDLQVESGELLGLLGPNGAGKTTLIRHITGDLRAARGHVHVLGRDAADGDREARRKLGVIPQSAGLFSQLTVESHLGYFARLKGIARGGVADEVERVIALNRLEPIRHSRAGALSGGQQRQVMVALALLGDPELLVLDEPTLGLDPLVRRNVWLTIEEQREDGRTVLLTSHYLDEVERLADRVALIRDGVIAGAGTIDELCASLQKSVRVVVRSGGEGAPAGEHYFDDLDQAQAFVARHGLRAYSVGPVALEDAYLRVFGPTDESGAG